MKKLILIIMLAVLIIPNTSYAFSFSDLLWWKDKVIVEEEIIVELNAVQKMSVEEKLAVWLNAYKQDDLSLIAANNQYTNISAAELNYIIEEQLKDYTNPPIQDISVSMRDNRFILEGYALKPFKGNASAEIRVEVMDEQLYFHVLKARYKGLYIPGSLVGRLLFGYLESVSDFFFSGDIKLEDIIIENNAVEFVIR
ncbi:hypothetical protein ISR92_02615 [Patescibacteria group bacterium]|nr:hypothetical protein [Patescibacteria group bacterium]